MNHSFTISEEHHSFLIRSSVTTHVFASLIVKCYHLICSVCLLHCCKTILVCILHKVVLISKHWLTKTWKTCLSLNLIPKAVLCLVDDFLDAWVLQHFCLLLWYWLLSASSGEGFGYKCWKMMKGKCSARYFLPKLFSNNSKAVTFVTVLMTMHFW